MSSICRDGWYYGDSVVIVLLRCCTTHDHFCVLFVCDKSSSYIATRDIILIASYDVYLLYTAVKSLKTE